MALDIALEFAICFIVRLDQVLLVNRRFAPNMGMWNGVGGRIEPGETPRDCIVREVEEETGIHLDGVRFAGHVTWTLDRDATGGMHCFIVEVPAQFTYETPRPTDEGILDWKELAWVMDPRNRGVVPNVPRFLPRMVADTTTYTHHFLFTDGQITEYRATPMSAPDLVHGSI